ncbi:MAG: phosphoribosylglycinamide synthetase C domain-containing protein, partial [Porticoccaceae bacterium]|nr:phosphoribosylglycinamide synthetase C domain-containing protein [Porticoccaceae bacterium]
VLCATALGKTVAKAQQAAYEVAAGIEFTGLYKRSDIAWRAIEREQKS